NTELGVVAVVRDDDACFVSGLDDGGIVPRGNFLAIDGQLLCHKCRPSQPLSDVHSPMRPRLTREIGMRYFQQVVISWSTRRRGNVQRIQIMTKTRNRV